MSEQQRCAKRWGGLDGWCRVVGSLFLFLSRTDFSYQCTRDRILALTLLHSGAKIFQSRKIKIFDGIAFEHLINPIDPQILRSFDHSWDGKVRREA